MSFLNNFRLHYHTKNIENFIQSENYEEFFHYLLDLKKNEKLFFQLSLKYISSAINNFHNNFSDKKIIWLNSFLIEDLDYLEKFFSFYLSDKTFSSYPMSGYVEAIDKIMLQKDEITFNTLVNQSFFFQWMILNSDQLKYKFISNEIPFFSTKDNFNFTKSTITQSFIFLINDPYVVYQKIKKHNNNDQEVARNIFLNLDNNFDQKTVGKTIFSLSKRGWHTNTQSWKDPNVINSLRGKVILLKDLVSDPYETLSSIILHLIQSGVKIELDYGLIEKYINNNPILPDEAINISQKEKKFIDKYISDISLNDEF